MIAVALLAILLGTALAWGGPLDPGYFEDWVVWSIGMFLACWGLWRLTCAMIP